MEKSTKTIDGATLAQGNGALVSSQHAQITTVDMFDQTRAKGALMVADMISTSSLIPDHYQRRPDNVLVAMYRSARLGMDLFAYMETTYPVNGRLGHEAKFVTSLINTSGKFRTPLLYEMGGEIIRDPDGTLSPKSTRKCKAWAILKDVDEKISQEVDIEMAFREGWATKLGPDRTLKTNKWQTMPDVMLQYRAAKFFGNMYCPELVMGLNTRDELEDISDNEMIDDTGASKEIFEKGEQVDATPAPVLDPAMEVKQHTTTSTESAPQTVTTPVEAAAAVPPATETISPADLSGDPPTDLAEFRQWFDTIFATRSHEVDVFLLGKKWLTMGETHKDLSNSKLKNLREQWDKFKAAYEIFRQSRKGGAV
jgi:hypothetical protein